MLKEKSALAPSQPRSPRKPETKAVPDFHPFLKKDPIAEFSQALWMVLREWFGDVDMRSEIEFSEFETVRDKSKGGIGSYVEIGENLPCAHIEFFGIRVVGGINAEVPEDAIEGSRILKVLAEANQSEGWRTVHLQVHLTEGVPVISVSTPLFDQFDHSCIEDPSAFAAWRNQANLAEVA
ncbi:MAG: hypothetical protein ACO1SV_12430 [Fimbriimonas sp.]